MLVNNISMKLYKYFFSPVIYVLYEYIFEDGHKVVKVKFKISMGKVYDGSPGLLKLTRYDYTWVYWNYWWFYINEASTHVTLKSMTGYSQLIK